MADLSVKLDRIEKAVDRIRVKVQMPNEVIEDVATAVEQISGSIPDIFKVGSIEERDLLNAKENDMCVVYNKEISIYDGSNMKQTLYFPNVIVSPTPITSNYSPSPTLSGASMFRITLQPTKFKISYRTTTNITACEYTSTDGITYTRISEDVEHTLPSVPVESEIPASQIDPVVYPFIQFISDTLYGVYVYLDGSWYLAKINSNVTADKILKGETVYTDNGVTTGTLFSNDADGMKTGIIEAEYFLNNLPSLDALTVFTNLYRNYKGEKIYCANLLNTNNITDFAYCFYKNDQIKEIDLSSWNTSKGERMSYMFYGCKSLMKCNLSNFNTAKVTTMNSMFTGSTSLTEVDLSSFVGTSLTDVGSMFSNCTALTKIDIRNLTFTKVTSYNNMLNNVPTNCLIIVKDTTAKNWIKGKFSSYTNIKTVAEYGA